MRLRQEVVNVVLAECLQDAGLTAVPEQIIRAAASGDVRLPDVIVDFQGLRLAIEGEFATTPDAEAKAIAKATSRVEEGLAHLGIGVVYPAEAASWTFPELRERLPHARLAFGVASELPERPSLTEGDVGHLGEGLRRAYETLVEDEALQRAVAVLEVAVDEWVRALQGQPGSTGRYAAVLGIHETPKGGSGPHGPALTAEERVAVNRVAGLVLTNALIFQEILSRTDNRVSSIAVAEDDGPAHAALPAHWRFILDEVNYAPIFHLARGVLVSTSASHLVDHALRALVGSALQIVRWRAALRHDLMGRLYHRLLPTPKYLGAYYTSVSAAVLLLKLALGRGAVRVDWSDLTTVSQLRVADLACGTGTLLMAAADACIDNHVRDCVVQHRQVEMAELQRLLLGHVIWGYDVLPSAVHLTASTLMLRHPEVPVNVTNLHSLPLGGDHHELGTLEFLFANRIGRATPLLGPGRRPQRVRGKGEPEVGSAELPLLDVCVMNPPFTRTAGENLLFGNLPKDQRPKMQKRLQKGVRMAPPRPGSGARGLSASITAGLGSVFVALADRRLKPGGTMALVLPQGLLSGVAWAKTRDLLERDYDLDCIVVSHEPDRWNFSDNTDLSECLVVARRREVNGESEGSVTCVNLWRNPRNPTEALAVARSLGEAYVPDALGDQGALQLRLGSLKMGEAVAIPQRTLRQGLWQFGCAYAQSELLRAFMHLRERRLYLPGRGVCAEVPLAALSSFAAVGPDRRDVHDGFEEASGETPFPAFWNHDSERVLTLNQVPNRHLSPLPKAKPGRHLRKAHDLWPRAGRLLIAEKFWLNTDRLAAVYLPLPVLSNVWWPTRLNHRGEQAEQVAALWLNSTLGLTMVLGHRGETRGAWCQLKKPIVEQMPVLDLDRLKRRQWRALLECFEQVADATLQPFPGMEDDPVRAAIDEAISGALGLPDVAPLRAMLAREPVVTLDPDRLTRHPY
ncbi:MAG: hypothetical protein FJX75_09240 [Armatimonadetes bacterium]|nr:hypothetical protein [Armatimonadota bacterium]